jgi:hypothetical protein
MKNERDNYGQELDKSTGMVEMHVDDAEAARLLWRQSEAACAQMHAQRDAAIRERDEALAILRGLAAGGAAAFNDAMDRARKLLDQP